RSFADGDGDGTGDIPGLRARLPWVRDLGVDALWVNPWYPSPMVDGGYDVADYRDVDRRFVGLPDVDDLPDEVIDDPVWRRSGFLIRGRDGCRVPLPWSGEEQPFGFSPPGVRTWLPQPPAWVGLTAATQGRDPGSMLALYRAALAIRRAHPGLAGERLALVPAPPGILAFDRDAGLRCLVNVSGEPIGVPAGFRVLLRSDATAAAGATRAATPLPRDAAAWLEPAGIEAPSP
ncbi:MAG TPA: alpha-amylase family glycosyl hydrolase, partial [Candidatus Limnocylindrales bacterium]|nr:alpha-amylase family glycosyl hydrolase [Candidatus Limnocylindrales bacterium]